MECLNTLTTQMLQWVMTLFQHYENICCNTCHNCRDSCIQIYSTRSYQYPFSTVSSVNINFYLDYPTPSMKAFMSHVNKLLVSSDIYGYPVTLNFQNKTKFKSSVGGSLSLLTIAFIIVLTFSAAQQLFSMGNSQTVQQDLIDFAPALVNITGSNFQFIVSVAYDDDPQLIPNKPLFNITAFQASKEHKKEFKLQPCLYHNFGNINSLNYSKQYLELNLSNYYCPSLDQQFLFKGTPNSESFGYIKLIVSKCLDSRFCHSLKELNDLVRERKTSAFRIQLGFTNSYFANNSNTLSPFLYTDYVLTTSRLDQYTRTSVLIQKTIFIEDLSIIPYQTNLQKQVFFNVKPENIRSQSVSMVSDVIAEYNIMLGQEYTYIKKTYGRIDTFLAYAGGILQTSIFILALIIGNYNKYGFYVQLANHLYNFDMPPSKDEFYFRQDAQEEPQLSSIDRLTKRIHERVERVKNAIELFKKGTRKLMLHHQTQTRLSHLFLKEEQKSEVGEINSIQIETSKHQPQIPFIDELPSQESDANHPHKRIVQEVKHNHVLAGKTLLQNQTIKKKQSVRFHQTEERKQIEPQHVDQPDLEYSSRQAFLTSSFEDILKYHQHIKMSGMYLLSRMLCRRIFYKTQAKIQLLDKAVKMLKKDTDIAALLDKLHDIDKLKKLLLNPHQTFIFNYTPKPVVRVTQSKFNDVVTFQNDLHPEIQSEIAFLEKMQRQKNTLLQNKASFTTMKSLFKLYTAYDHLYHVDNSKHGRRVNRKLIHLIGTELRDVFETSYYLKDSTHVLTRSRHTTLSPQNFHISEQSHEDEQPTQLNRQANNK